MSADGAGRVEVVALDGIPEIRPGDDLGAILTERLAVLAAGGSGALRPDDVLVVTQKIVSKAEGAIIDLTTVEPRPEAVAFAARWDRDPRQVEVVLREARRVVRMANGVIITETAHGFVCANGGVDASNVGPASGSIVTLLPVDPDGSAGRIRATIRDRLGVGPAGHRLGFVRPAVALGDRRRWRSASPASARLTTCGASRMPTVG